MGWKVPKIWEGETCYIIGGGPSLPVQFGVPEELIRKVVQGNLPPLVYSPYMKALHDKHIIGVNNAYQLGNWVGVLFFGDYIWYESNKDRLRDWPGLVVTCCDVFKGGGDGVKCLDWDGDSPYGLSVDSATVGWNYNSGAAAIDLAIHFGARRVVLLGFDMELADGRLSHWHPPHTDSQKPSPIKRLLTGFPIIAQQARAIGVEIINANPNSTIGAFPKISIKELLNGNG